MEDKIWNLLVDYGMNEKAADQCVKELLVLYNVVGQSEQSGDKVQCNSCHKWVDKDYCSYMNCRLKA